MITLVDQILLSLALPLDTRLTNLVLSGGNMIVETQGDYLQRVDSNSRYLGMDVKFLSPSGIYEINDFISKVNSQIITFKPYTMLTGLEDSDFTEITGGEFTQVDKNKLDGIETGAQVNVIEVVKKNGTSLSVTSKSVDISVPTLPSDIGAEPAFNKNSAFNKNFGTTAGTVLEGRTFGSAANNNTGDFATVNHNHTGVYEPAKGSDDNYVTDDEKAALHSHSNKTALDSVSNTNTGDNAINTTSNTYADSKVADSISNGVTTIAPSQNAVFDALTGKSDTSHNHSGVYQPVGSYEVTTNKGSNNGYAGLDSGGKVPLSQLPSTLLKYIGQWNASTNTPTLLNPDIAKAGYVYDVTVSGTQFGLNFVAGDWMIYNAIGVPELSKDSDSVVSVNGQTGAVVLNADDISDTTTTHKFTTANDISKLAGVEAGSQVNILESVQKNGVDLTITNKKVNVIVPTQPSDIGAAPTIHNHDGQTITPDVVEYQTPAVIPTALGSMYYDTAHSVLSTVLGGGVILQNGLEMYVRSVNKTGIQVNDGQVVYINSAQGNRPTIALAQANTENTSYVIGVATQDIANNGEGFVTVFGTVNGYNTSTFNDGDKLYLSPTTAGGLTNIKPTAPNHSVIVGIALNSTVNGSIFVHPTAGYELGELHDVDTTKTKTTTVTNDRLLLMDSEDSNIWKNISPSNLPVSTAAATLLSGKKPYHGVVSRATVAPLPTNITTTTFTLSTGTTPMEYYNQGVYCLVNTSKTTTLSGAAGLYWIYFSDAVGTLTNSTAFPGTDGTNVLVSAVYWNGSNYGIVWDERHNHKRDTEWHSWAHRTIGARYGGSGLDFSFTGNTNTTTAFNVSSGSIFDEDIEFTIGATTQARIWYQTSATTYGFLTALSTRPYYGGAADASGVYSINPAGYGLNTITQSNRYFNYFVYGSTSNLSQIHVFAETTTTTGGYTSVANARAIAPPSLSAFGLTPELKLLYRVVVNGAGLIQTPIASDDYRTTSSVSGGAVPSTTASSVSFVASGDIASTNVQSAIQELDAEKLSIVATQSCLSGNGTIASPLQAKTDIERAVSDCGFANSWNFRHTGTLTADFNRTAILAGTVSSLVESDVYSSSTSANSGYLFASNTGVFNIGRLQEYSEIFKLVTNTANKIHRFGHGSGLSTTPTDAIYFEVIGGALYAKTVSSTASNTSVLVLASISPDVLYRLRIRETTTSVEFYAIGDDLQTATVTINTNIPTGARLLASSFIHTGTSVVQIGSLHFFSYTVAKIGTNLI